jgi:type VI protein secretion system component VasK
MPHEDKMDIVSGYGGTKNAWIEDMQSLIRRQTGIKSPKVRRKLGGLLPYLLVGEPGSGKTTFGKQLYT